MMENRTLSKRYIKVSQFTLDDIVYKLNAHSKESRKRGHFTKYDLFQEVSDSVY